MDPGELTTLADEWAACWPLMPDWYSIASYKDSVDTRYRRGAAAEPVLDLREPAERDRQIWKELAQPSAGRPPQPAVITYSCVFDTDGPTPKRPPLAPALARFAGEHWHSAEFGARFAQPPLGWQHWYIAIGRFGWSTLAPLVAATAHRHPLNSQGGVSLLTGVSAGSGTPTNTVR